jgi:CBS domain-containing protein
MQTIRKILSEKGSDVWSTSPGATVYEALQLMADKDVGALPVVEQGKLVGIFSERDYARKVILLGKTSKKTLVREIMTTPCGLCHSRHDQRAGADLDDCQVHPPPASG